ncbi:MAG: DUF5123 domain-containing protein [Bacteroidetes bacterium]|nr:DUF5123 domain-containing protein [Bacteroidota bacterium]
MTTITRSLLLATSLFFSTIIIGQTRYYVNAAASGAGDGSSWSDAYPNLQDALLHSVYGDTIWVAQGKYYPTTSTNRFFYFDLKNGVKLFGGFVGNETQLNQRDWNLYPSVLSGDIGVPGDSTDNSYTVASYGFADSTTIFDGFVVTGGNANSQSQFEPDNGRTKSGGGLYINNSNPMLESRPLIINCTFMSNYAINAGGGIYCRSSSIGSSSAIITNCIFQQNYAYSGAGMYLAGSGNYGDTKIEQCIFKRNYSDFYGAGIHFENNYGSKNLQITNDSFNQNFCWGGGSGVAIENTNEIATTTILDCNFNCNKSLGEGSSIVLVNYANAKPLKVENCNIVADTCFSGVISIYDGELNISNTKFVGNIGKEAGITLSGSAYKILNCLFINSTLNHNNSHALIYSYSSNNINNCDYIANCTFANNNLDGKSLIHRQTANYPPLRIHNTIIANNINQASTLLNTNNAELYISHSLVDVLDCSGIMTGPITCGPGMLYNLDPQFVDPDNGDFHLLPTSPAINAGNNAIVDSLGILTDIEGNPRIQGGTVDMGAYESSSGSNNPGVKYVNTNVQGGNDDGTSWANAYLDLQDALAASQYGDEIWVAQGTYYPTAGTDRNISFELKDGVKLYGGFVGNETQLSQRNWITNETILSGDIGMLGDSSDNSYTILFIGVSDTTTIVDGLIFKNGNADSPTSGGVLNKSNGAAIYISSDIYYAYPKILNCKFENNHAIKSGGAVYIINASQSSSAAPHFQNCLFKFNSADGEGGAIYKYGHSLVEIKDDIQNCTFENNSALLGGAISYTSYLPKDDTFEIVGCNFISNHAIQRGGGISLLAIYSQINEEKIEIRDCNFTNNQGISGGAIGMASNPSSLSITNSNFVGNLDTNSPNSFGAALAIFYGDQFLQDTNTFDLDISHCFFDNNSSNNSVIFLSNGNSLNNITKLTFKNNLVKNNSAGFVFNPFTSSNITNCIFEKNGSQENNFILTSYCHRNTISNSIFSNNNGILYKLGNPTATDTITNCTFHNNIGDTTATQLFGTALISNCIFDQEIEGNAFPFQAANVILENSLILSPDCSNLPAYVTCGADNIFGLAPVFADTAGGDFHLLPTSPGINAGNNDLVNTLGITSDYDGSPRIQFCNVDMGAFEAADYEVLSVSIASSTACSGQSNGSVQFTLLNGCEPYSYLWTNGTSTGTGATNLIPGDYTFTITDALGKSVEAQVEVPTYPSIVATLDATPYHCATGVNGTANLTINSGAAPFQLEWYDGSTDTILTNLSPGVYTVTITDANGCTFTDSVTVGLMGSLSLGINISPITCSGGSDGLATVQPIGGTMPYTWLWQNGETTPMLDSLGGGTYSATVTDAIGCTGDIEFTITPPTPVNVDIMVMQPLCFGKKGIAIVSGSGGTGNLHFLWDNGATTASTMLDEGTHTVTVTDESGCTAVGTVTIQAPPQLQVSLSVEPDILCFGASNGTIIVTPSGGSGQYGWNGPIENLSAGTYTVTVTDSNGCTAISETTIAEHPEITVTDTVTDASSPTASDGSVVLNSVTGGTGIGYQFEWSPTGTGNVISTEQNLTGVPTGDYSLTVTDSQGCSAVFPFSVDFNSAAVEARSNPFGAAIVPNPSGRAGASLFLSIHTGPLKVSVFDTQGRLVVAGQTIESSYALPKGLAAGSYRVVLENGKGRMVLTWVVGE